MQELNQTGEGSLWKEEIDGFMDWLTGDETRHPEPIAVARAVQHALFDAEPKRRYLVTPGPGQFNATIRVSLWRLVELNRGHEFTLSREELIAMLDEELAR